MPSAEDFLDVIFGGLEGDEHVCVSRAIPKRDGDGVWFRNHLEGDRQWRKWDATRQAHAWYYNVSTVDGALNANGTMVSRGRANLRYYYVLVLDDIGQKTGPPPVEPTYKIETSDGSFQWGYCLEKGDDFARFEALIEAIHKKGWGDAGAGGSYRVVRVPGSANLKPGRQEFRSHITCWEPDRYWTLDSLAAAFDIDINQIPVKDVGVTNKTGGAVPLDDVDPLLDWLAARDHLVRDGGGEWVAVICPWADQHTTGDNIAGYSPLGRGAGDWVQTRAFRCLHEHCQSHDYKSFSAWAEGLGAPVVPGRDAGPWHEKDLAALAAVLNLRKERTDD